MPFRGHVNRLCTRAGKTGWALKGKAIRNTFPDWLKRKVNVTKTEDAFWSSVEESVNTEMMDRLDSGAGPDKDKDKPEKDRVGHGRSSKKCIFCNFPGHDVSECRKMQAARAAGNFNRAPDNKSDNKNGTGTGSSAKKDKVDSSSTVSNSRDNRSRNVTCYNCQRPGHISTFCPEPKRERKQDSELPANVASDNAPVYLNVPEMARLVHEEGVDELDTIVVGNNNVDLPLYHVLSQPRDRKEVFSFSTPDSDALQVPTSIMHSYTRSLGGQSPLTIWDTAALLSMVPMSTVRALNLSYTPGSDVSFVVANGSRMSPIGYCTDMQFSFPESDRLFGDKVYVVENAPFQLLLGIRFLYRHWAGIFLPWAMVVIKKPCYIEVQGSLERSSPAPPLRSEVIDDLRLADSDPGVPDEVAEEVPVLFTVPMGPLATLPSAAMEVGKRDLVADLDSPVQNDFAAEARVSRDFIRGVIKFGSSCPEFVINKAIDLVLEHWSEFSWHEMDLGCISDIPYDTKYVDDSPCVCKSRRHNYAERNAAVIEGKSRPLINLGVYRTAGPDVVDRAQLVVVRTKPDDPINLKYCRIAHDFRCKNDKALLVPVPMATRPELYSFLTKFKYFWKTDADRGFLQVVQSPSAVRHTGFELFNQLWVSERMLFGQINGPSFFELNFNVMAHDLKFNQRVVKNFFDDILGGGLQWEELLHSWSQLLSQAKVHGWKFKPAKTEFGFEEIVAVGALYKDGTISVIDKLVDAVRSLRFPRSITEVRSVLGLFNQFRDRVPSYALRVHALTQLTRRKKGDPSKGSITMTVEAVEEFRALQEYLLSPSVLTVFRHGWRTFVYTDASLGSSASAVPGGLGAVITQVNPVDSKEYVCAFASAGLSPAQRNYPPVRLEALAFVFVLSKFYDWLEMNEFTWRTDARAHKFIIDNRLSPNPALARYFVGLQAFRFNIEWIPCLRMIADPLSRMVIVPGDGDGDGGDVALTTSSLVFGEDIGRRLLPPASTLCTICDSGLPLGTYCTVVLSSLPPALVEPLLTTELPLTALAAAPDDVPPPSVQPFSDPGYSIKDRAKLDALPHVRAFFTSRSLPTDPDIAHWV